MHFMKELDSIVATDTGGFDMSGSDLRGKFPSRNGMITGISALSVVDTWSLTGPAGAGGYVFYDDIVPVFNSMLTKDTVGNGLHESLSGRFWFLSWLLSRLSADDVDVAQNTAESGVTMIRFPFQYPFDRRDEEYLLPVTELEAITWKQGGSSTMQTVTSRACKLYGEGKFLPGSPEAKKRMWIEINGSAGKIDVPPGRYHFMAIMNAKSSGGCKFDGGLVVDGPNYSLTAENGQDLNRSFAARYKLANLMYSAVDDESAVAGGSLELEDIIQVIYAPDLGTLSYAGGIRGPFEIKVVDSADPQTNRLIALKVVDS